MKGIKRQKTVAGFLMLRIGLALLATFAVMILVITTSSSKDLAARELSKLELLADKNAQIASEFMATMYDKQMVIASAVQNVGSMAEDARIPSIAGLIQSVGDGQENILSLFYVAEPNTLKSSTPNGYTIFASESGVKETASRYETLGEDIYQQALASKVITVADPFPKTVDGKQYNVITLLYPVQNAAGKPVGMVGCNIDVNVLANAAYDHGGFETFENYIICGHQTMIFNSANPAAVGKPFKDVATSKDPSQILNSASNAAAFTILDELKDGSLEYRAFTPFYIGNSPTPWLSGTSITQTEFNSQIYAQIYMLLFVSGLGLLFLILICIYGIRRTLKPIKAIEAATHALAEGKLHTHLDVKTNDEFGRLAVSFNEATETIAFYVDDIARAMGEMANGNFDVYPSKQFIGDFEPFDSTITGFIANICNALNDIGISATNVSGGSDQIASGSASLSQGATEQASSVEELTATIEELSDKVRDNNEHAKLAGQRVQEAGTQVNISNQQMQELLQAMHAMTNDSNEIGKIIKTIEDIAFQTNILALNAAVEAARAGAAGKGFAVVADEVRNLASKSAEAAKNSTSLIQNSITSVRSGAQLAENAAGSLLIVQEKAASVVEIVDEIQRASDEQFRQIQQITASAEQISDIIQLNTASAEESAAASEELAGQAQVLQGAVRRFKLNKVLTNRVTSLETPHNSQQFLR